MAAADNYTADVLARFRDFVGPGVQWQRALWDVGLAVALRELHEAAFAVQAGALSKSAMKWYAQTLDSRVNSDPGVGAAANVQRLRRLLGQDLTVGSVNHHELDRWTDDVQEHYLDRWRTALGGSELPGREQCARAIAAHLVGEQLSPEYLRDWTHNLESGGQVIDAQALLAEAQALAAQPARRFEVMVVFVQPPRAKFARPTEWRDGTDVSLWFEAHGFAAVRQHGGLLIEIEARDAYAAARHSGTIVDRLEARFAVGTRDQLAVRREAFVAGEPSALAMRASRRAEVRALERENALLHLDPGGDVDQSLELLSHLNTSADPVAAAAGWSAVESLLSGPGDDDKVVTADRLASLVACAWPRAELTTIAWNRVYQAGGTPDGFASELKGYATNRERAERILQAILNGEPLGLDRPADRLAERRMDRLVRSPAVQLRAVQRNASEALRRLYRQRNLVVHGGQTSGFSLASALRVGAPLVGAGLDRIAHASLVSTTRPLELAARASFEISRAGTSTAPPLTAMLE